MKALLLENLHPLASTILPGPGSRSSPVPGALDEDELIAALDGVDLLGIRSKTEVTARVLERQPGAGRGRARSASAPTRSTSAPPPRPGIAAFNAPYSNTRSVVELAVAKIIAMARRLTERDKALHAGSGTSRRPAATRSADGRSASSATATSASQLSVVAEMLGMQVYFYDTEDKLALGNAQPLRLPRGAARAPSRR